MKKREEMANRAQEQARGQTDLILSSSDFQLSKGNE